jgi:putative endonuclease
MDQASYGWQAKRAGPPNREGAKVRLVHRSCADVARPHARYRSAAKVDFHRIPSSTHQDLPCSTRFADAKTETLRSVIKELPDNVPADQRRERCSVHQQMLAKQTVYVIQSETAAKQHYVGLTSNVVSRVAAHNAGESFHTRRYRPWRLVVAMEFANQERAIAFERYLKSGSGCAFLKRHLL